jgi:hypothetical protein
LLGGPIDDLVAAWIVDEAEKRGVEVAPEEQEAIREMVAARVAQAEAESDADETVSEPEAVTEEDEETTATNTEEAEG